MPRLRLATAADAGAIAAIYASIVRETPISFELEPPDAAQMAHRIADVTARFPWLVCVEGDTVLGYAYARPYRERPAYQWTVETSVYVTPAARGRGIGRRLYMALFAVLAELGYRTAIASITLPNAASVALHEAVGFQPAGVTPHVGHKHGAWHDVGIWHRRLAPLEAVPRAPRPVGELVGTPAWEAALGA